MGSFKVTIEIGDPEGRRFEKIEALVDAGATTTVVPASVLRRLRVVATRRDRFEYADGRQVELDMAETRARIGEKETTTWVIFGDEGVEALLGSYTLEGLLSVSIHTIKFLSLSTEF